MIRDGATSLPITDNRMTRFWITLEQSVDFVIQCFVMMRGAEIFVAKIPSMKITDLAKAIAPDLPHTILGIREGEKLHELMISTEDARHTLEFNDHYVIIPEIYSHNPDILERFLAGRHGKKPHEGFAYTSDTNTQWLSVEELKKLVSPYTGEIHD